MKRSHLDSNESDLNDEGREMQKKAIIQLYRKATENDKMLAAHRARKLKLLETFKNGDKDMVGQVLDNFSIIKSDGLLEAEFLSEALSWAAKGGNTDAVDLLLAKGAAVDVEDLDGNTPMYNAAEHGHTLVVQKLVEHGVDINALQNYWTPLTLAAAHGHMALVEYLLEEGAGVNNSNDFGDTALYRAASKGDEDIVRLLLEYGAEIERQTYWGETALRQAASRGQIEVVKLLLEKGAQIESAGRNGWTPLISAARRGKDAVVSLLLEHGARIDVKDNENMGPLDHAAVYKNTSTVRLLQEMGATS